MGPIEIPNLGGGGQVWSSTLLSILISGGGLHIKVITGHSLFPHTYIALVVRHSLEHQNTPFCRVCCSLSFCILLLSKISLWISMYSHFSSNMLRLEGLPVLASFCYLVYGNDTLCEGMREIFGYGRNSFLETWACPSPDQQKYNTRTHNYRARNPQQWYRTQTCVDWKFS